MKKPSPKKPIPPEVQGRLNALENLIDTKYEGKQSVFSKKTGVALSQIGQWFTGDRLLRENALDTLEEKTGLPKGYFDQPIGRAQSLSVTQLPIGQAIDTLGQTCLAMSDDQRKELGSLLAMFVANPRESIKQVILEALSSPARKPTEQSSHLGKHEPEKILKKR